MSAGETVQLAQAALWIFAAGCAIIAVDALIGRG